MMLKTVTLQEANGLLPLVREHFFRIHVMLAQLSHMRVKFKQTQGYRYVFDQRAEELLLIKRRISPKKRRPPREMRELSIQLENEMSELCRLGVVVKGLVPPHIDFLSYGNNEPILLCWHGGEREISHWHYLDDGPPARHPIDKGRFGPQVVH